MDKIVIFTEVSMSDDQTAMKKFFKLLLFIMLCHAGTTHGQKKGRELIDSLLIELPHAKDDTNKVNLLEAVTNAFGDDFPDESIKYDSEEISLATKLHWQRGIAAGYGHMGDDYLTNRDYANALKCYSNGYDIYNNLHLLRYITMFLAKKGFAYRELEQYDSSLLYFNKALNSGVRENDSFVISMIAGNIALVYINAKDYRHSLMYAARSLAIAEKLQTKYIRAKSEVPELTGLIGMDYLRLIDDTSGSRNMHQQKKINNDTLAMAIDYLQRGIEYCWKMHDDIDNAPMKGALTFSNSLSRAYMLMGDYKTAYEISGKALAIADTLKKHDEKKIKGIREQVIKMNQNELRKDDLEIKLKKNQQILFIAAIILLLVVVLLIVAVYVARTRKMELQRQLQAHKIRNDIASDLHDSIGSSLSGIMLMSDIARSKPSGADGYLAQISDTSGKIIEDMSDIVWAINPDNDSMRQMLVRMREFAALLLEKKEITLQFDVSGEIDNVKLSMEERKNFFLAFKEIIHNAFKHACCSHVTVNIVLQDNGAINMTVGDNGTGFDTAQQYTGNGLNNLQKRVVVIRGTMKIISAPGEGTVTRVAFTPVQAEQNIK